MRTITLNPTQQRRFEVLTRLSSGTLTPAQAAELLRVSPRHLRRLQRAFDAGGAPVLVHGNHGRSPANRSRDEVRQQLRALAGPEGPYADYNICHLQEL